VELAGLTEIAFSVELKFGYILCLTTYVTALCGRFKMRDSVDLFFKRHKRVAVLVERQKCSTYMRQNGAKWNSSEEFATKTYILSEIRVNDVPTYSTCVCVCVCV